MRHFWKPVADEAGFSKADGQQTQPRTKRGGGVREGVPVRGRAAEDPVDHLPPSGSLHAMHTAVSPVVAVDME